MKPLKVFIIQPFGTRYADKFRALIKEVCADRRFDGIFTPFHAAEERTIEPRLQDRINSYLRDADICIADLAGTRNENALLEVGAAYALGTPVIPFSDHDLPSDIRGHFYIRIDLSRLDDESTARDFKTALHSRLLEARGLVRASKNLTRFNSHAFVDRGAVDFHSLMSRCEGRIFLLTTNLNYLVNEGLVAPIEAIETTPEKPTFLELLESELPNKKPAFELKILALDPDSNFANQRALSLGRNRQLFREQMRDDLNTVKNFVESGQCPVSGEVRIYDDYPLQMTFFFDDVVVSSVVAAARSSRYCVTYMHSLREMGAQESYERHFDHLWERAAVYAASQRTKTRAPRWRPPVEPEHKTRE
jgi:nucleoside 2-deoxyribosyltransferase